MLTAAQSFFSVASLGLFACIGLLNTTSQLALCAPLFVLTTLCFNLLCGQQGQKRAIYTLIFCIFLHTTLILTRVSPALVVYEAWPKAILGISFVSIACAIQAAFLLHKALKSHLNFYGSNFVSLSCAAILDSSIMMISLYLLGKFSLENAMIAYLWDIGNKLFHAGLVTVLLFALDRWIPGRNFLKS
jgi:hypothetical protein